MDPRVAKVLAETFQADPASVTEGTSPQNLPAWDSLGHMNLVAALEKAFSVSFTMDEILSMQDAGAVAKLIAAKSA